jgi:hypothetical protein
MNNTKFPKMNNSIDQSRGASLDTLSFYSTTNSVTYNNSNILLGDPQRVSRAESKKLGLKSKAKQTGYSKNCIPFVVYDKQIDETDLKYLDEMFLTTNTTVFLPPGQKSLAVDNISRLLESGFTKNSEKRDNISAQVYCSNLAR